MLKNFRLRNACGADSNLLTVADVPTGPKQSKATVLTVEDEAIVVAFRRHTLLPLDDFLYALQPTLTRLTRPSLHRCLQRHGISRFTEMEGDKPNRFKLNPLQQMPGLNI